LLAQSVASGLSEDIRGWQPVCLPTEPGSSCPVWSTELGV
jgi:hypothetical protein